MPIARANVDFWWSVAKPRNNKSYGYGGNWSATNPNASTDCSGIVSFVLAALTRGQAAWQWTRLPYSTESWRVVEVGQRGPFGTICVKKPQDIPADAAVKIGCQHGGGGRNSHMACTLMDRPGGINIESSGSGGQRWGGTARGYNDSLFHDWHYLPGPIAGAGVVVPAPEPVVYYAQEGDTNGRVLHLQKYLNAAFPTYAQLEEDGTYGPVTAAAVRQFQSRTGVPAGGDVGPLTLAELKKVGFVEVPKDWAPVRGWPREATDRELLEYIAMQLGPGDPSWASQGMTLRDKIWGL